MNYVFQLLSGNTLQVDLDSNNYDQESINPKLLL